jgi:hypothetical protein
MGVQAAWANGEYRVFDPKNWHKAGEWSFWPPTAKPPSARLPVTHASANYGQIYSRWGASVFDTVVGMAANQLNISGPAVNNRTTYLPGSHTLHHTNNSALGSPADPGSAWGPSWVPLAIGSAAAAATIGCASYYACQSYNQPRQPSRDPNGSGIELLPLNPARLPAQAIGAGEPLLPPGAVLAGVSQPRSVTVPASRRRSIP